ncbi:MAG: thioredoxin domain-containing protein [Theionarchaea archaeon]|nr:thioredoxin domain-containing protein [Theionarchaea archaeon]
MKGENSSPNRLIHEKSPYLLQHAYNPVDWYPWGEEAFKRAQEQERPIFLSIGYSTCHWCHVMEKESFEDKEVALLLNKWFVCVKVDREERPDLDSLYMTVCQAMTGRGGWPLTIVMTPDKKPFFAGTYIPKDSRFSQAGLLEILPRIHELWIGRKEDLVETAETVIQSIAASEVLQGEDLHSSILESGYSALADLFDDECGGFSTAPKFPMAHHVLFLLRYWNRTQKKRALFMVEKTLQSMRRGGIYDHVGFGIHRYAADMNWLVPHFEKMLYDQALTSMAYIEAYQATQNPLYKKTAEEICEYVLRDMKGPEGGFYSAQDADSEGREGKFYTWNEAEIDQVDHAELIKIIFDIRKEGNFPQSQGQNILHMGAPVSEYAGRLKTSPRELQDILEHARRQLLEMRTQRAPPGIDDKRLTDWNGLMVASLSKGGQVFGNEEYTKAAEKAVTFLLETNMKDESVLYHRFRDSEAAIPGFLDDYAFLAWGLLELYEATFTPGYLRNAVLVTDSMIKRFWDTSGGGFYFTEDGTSAMTRRKISYDGSYPSGNSVAVLNLLRLARMTGDHTYEKRAAQTMKAFGHVIRHLPSSHTMFLVGYDFALGPSAEVVIAGSPGDQDTQEMIHALRRIYVPNKVVLLRSGRDDLLDEICPFAKDLVQIQGKATAYVCHDFQCNLPTTSSDEVAYQLRELSAHSSRCNKN